MPLTNGMAPVTPGDSSDVRKWGGGDSSPFGEESSCVLRFSESPGSSLGEGWQDVFLD